MSNLTPQEMFVLVALIICTTTLVYAYFDKWRYRSQEGVTLCPTCGTFWIGSHRCSR